jgi:transposase
VIAWPHQWFIFGIAMQKGVDYKKLYEEQQTLLVDYKQRLEDYQSRCDDYKSRYEEEVKRSDELHFKVTALQHQLVQIKKMVFGSKQERFVPVAAEGESRQLSFELTSETMDRCKITDGQKISYVRTPTTVTDNKPRLHPGRMKLPEELRRETIVLMPENDVSGLVRIGDDVTEILEYTAPEFYVKQYIRPKYVQPLVDNGSTVITAALPGRLMEKCMAGEGLLAQILVDKYCDHLPLHRQLQRFSRLGITLAQSTINDWVKAVLEQLNGLYAVHKRQVLQSGYLHADETPIKVLDRDKKGSSHQGFYWVYHNSAEKIVLFDYRPGRGREGPDDILKDFQGYLQTDGYVVYNIFDERGGITLQNCMSHARRKFYDSLQSDPARAQHALSLFQRLYDTEHRIKEEQLSGELLLELRRKESVPVLEILREWMIGQYPQVLPKSPLGRAIEYSVSRWRKLTLYTTDPRLQIDNNPVENALRPVAVGRKNYLFAGSHEAAQRAAMIYSLFATCRSHNINPYDWLKDVLSKMHLYTTSNIHQLLPQNWKQITD